MELHKTIIRKFKNRKVQSFFIDNIWGANGSLLCVIDIFSKYAWVIPLKDKKGITVINAFQNILKESNRKPYKIWVDKGSEFHNRSVNSWLKKRWYRNIFNA